MTNIIDFQSKDEQQFKQNVEMAVAMTVDGYIDKGRIAKIYREELIQKIISKVQGFARQFLENSSFAMPYHPSGDEAVDAKSEAVATMASEQLNQIFLTVFAQSLSKTVDLEVQLWIKTKELSDIHALLAD